MNHRLIIAPTRYNLHAEFFFVLNARLHKRVYFYDFEGTSFSRWISVATYFHDFTNLLSRVYQHFWKILSLVFA